MKEEPDSLDKAIELARKKSNQFDYSIDLDDNRIKRYKGYASIAFDLKTVGEFVSLLLDLRARNVKIENQGESVDRLAERSLFVSSIITYARCFTDSKGRGIRLESKDCFNSVDAKYLQGHNSLMEIRNQYLAHAGVSNSERVYATANFNVKGDEVTFRLSHEIFGQYGISDNDLIEFKEIVQILLERTVGKRDEASKNYVDSLNLLEKKELLKKAYFSKLKSNS
jgi:hypothetical protein